MQESYKQFASDANTLRVIWIGDHKSMDDTYWQDDEEYEGGEHVLFCTVNGMQIFKKPRPISWQIPNLPELCSHASLKKKKFL